MEVLLDTHTNIGLVAWIGLWRKIIVCLVLMSQESYAGWHLPVCFGVFIGGVCWE